MHVSECEFRAALELALDDLDTSTVQAVTGPGRSGAIAAVYASHYLGVPFIPFGQRTPLSIMIVDTNCSTGKTLRKAKSRYETMLVVTAFNERHPLKFWYER